MRAVADADCLTKAMESSSALRSAHINRTARGAETVIAAIQPSGGGGANGH